MGGLSLVIQPDGVVVRVNLAPGRDHSALMYEHLNCRLVDCVSLTGRLDMWLDDEGLYTQPVNRYATLLARRYGLVWQPYHGPVLLCSSNEEGDSVDLTYDQVHELCEQLMDALGV